MSMKTVNVVLASAVATSGTFTVTYPAGTNAAWFQKGTQHQISAIGGNFTNPEDFGITTFGNTTCTVTWRHTSTLPAGTTVRVGLDAPGPRNLVVPETPTDPSPNLVTHLYPRRIALGAPIVADVDGVATALPTALTTVTINGAALSGSSAVFDVPRNVTMSVSPGGSTFGPATITGLDLYGATMIEQIPQYNTVGATTLAGVKAFKSVSSIAFAATLNSTYATATVGFGDVLGIPVFLQGSSFLQGEVQDGAAASAGTLVAGLAVNTVSTATTADVRGTYDPNAACDGSKAFELLVFLSDPTFKGVPQYDG